MPIFGIAVTRTYDIFVKLKIQIDVLAGEVILQICISVVAKDGTVTFCSSSYPLRVILQYGLIKLLTLW